MGTSGFSSTSFDIKISHEFSCVYMQGFFFSKSHIKCDLTSFITKILLLLLLF